jgi:hypothetical protein
MEYQFSAPSCNLQNSIVPLPRVLDLLQVLGDANISKQSYNAVLAKYHQQNQVQIPTVGSQWLNPVGRVVLIKSVLSTLPIFNVMLC